MMSNLNLTNLKSQEYIGKLYVKNIRKKLCGIQNQLKSRIRIRIRKKSFRIHNTEYESMYR